MESPPAKPVQVFCSYARDDASDRDQLEKQLITLRREKWIDFWSDRSITPGDVRQDEIDRHLFEAEIIIILISANFMSSDYQWGTEMTRALEMHDAGKATVIPILVHPVDLTGTRFPQLEPLPRDGKPVSARREQEIEAVWFEIANEIRQAVTKLMARQNSEGPPAPVVPTPSKSATSLVWLHLSDLLAGAPDGAALCEQSLPALLADMKNMVRLLGQPPDLVLLTGDLAFSGLPGQYEAVDRYLEQIVQATDGDPVLVGVPGNHDMVRPTPWDPAALGFDAYHAAEDAPCRQAVRHKDESALEYLSRLFAEYQRWSCRTLKPTWDRKSLSYREGLLPGDFMLTVEKGDLSLGLAGLNSAFLQQRDGDCKRKLAVEAEQLFGQDLVRWAEKRDTALLLMHHPPSWLHPWNRELFERDIYPPERFAACLFGHLHDTYCTGESGDAGQVRRWFQASSLFGQVPYHKGQATDTREIGYAWGRLCKEAPERGRLEYWPRQGIREGGALRFQDDPTLAPYPFAKDIPLQRSDEHREARPEFRRRRLSLPHSELRDEYDVVIIGSGYGGGAMAARLTESVGGQRRSICVLERGKEWRGGDFPQRPLDIPHAIRTRDNPTGLFEYHFSRDVDVLVGNGLGGTSLINANVMMDPDRRVFKRPEWPAALPDLSPYFERARGALHVQPGQKQTPPPRSAAFGDAARRHWRHPEVSSENLAITIANQVRPDEGISQRGCVQCGSCVTGCNYAAKNTVDMNYLALAERRGAAIFTGIEVMSIEKRRSGKYALHLKEDRPRPWIQAAQVVLCAGVFGTFSILSRSRSRHDLRISARLGKDFHGNGDILGFGYDCKALPSESKGPTSTTVASYWGSGDPEEHFVIAEGAIPGAMKDLVYSSLPFFRPFDGEADELTSEKLKEWIVMKADLLGSRSSAALNRSLILIGMGFEKKTGRLMFKTLPGPPLAERACIEWEDIAEQPFIQTIDETMHEIVKYQLQGTYLKTPRAREFMGNNFITVHPLGGCTMGKDPEHGVVNHKTEVFGHEGGLYIADGSIIPTSLGVSPALTIAALAEWGADQVRASWSPQR